ncbi:MAG: helix-turn-helix domain-containing protein [Clostridia bacterium]|nr:helix-turn-helix domain-containing protein [Clostridia bacterium]
MFYRNELDLVAESLKKCRVNVNEVRLRDDGCFCFHLGLERIFGSERPISVALSEIKTKCLYKAKNGMKLSYKYFLLPDTETPTALFVGPYLDAPLTISEIFEIGEKNGVLPSRQRYLEEYYSTLPVLSEESKLFTFLDSLLERIFRSPSFLISDVNNAEPMPASPMSAKVGDGEDVVSKMKTIEKRYEFENEMIRAVSLGQIHMEKQLLGVFSDTPFEKRVDNPLRNAKNYGIIMNTLLRKAAESGGVHPMYIDRVSSDFAFKIEAMKTLSGNLSLMMEMFRSYCLLVRNHAVKSYSPLVRGTIVLIDSDLTSQISLKTLAEKQNVSSGYLSSVFRKETGKTVTEYIRDRRMENAEYLLATTNLQIQTVALHSGILDLQYFSKLFKRHTGKTPKEYREELKNKNGN